MWFTWHPFDLATVTPSRYTYMTRENSPKRKERGKTCRLHSLKPESKIMVGWRWWFMAQAARTMQSWAVEFSKEQRNCAAPPSFTHLHPPKSSTADCLLDNISDILPWKPDLLHGCELMTTGAKLSACTSRTGGPATTMMDPQMPWEGTDIPNYLAFSQNWDFFWVASIRHKHQLPQTIVKYLKWW